MSDRQQPKAIKVKHKRATRKIEPLTPSVTSGDCGTVAEDGNVVNVKGCAPKLTLGLKTSSAETVPADSSAPLAFPADAKRKPNRTDRTNRSHRSNRQTPNQRSDEQPNYDWAKLNDEKLLDLRMCDLNLRIETTPLVKMADQLYRELSAAGLVFKPHYWLSDEWFAPDGIPGFAIPFFLAHPRLIRLERRQMLKVEGGTRQWCMKLLRHETGHAIDTAYALNRRKRYREIFGRYSQPYPETYRPKPRSKNFVQHLEPWYAQSHPAEDFAETFSVWMTPGLNWRKDYAGWKALKKLEYVDELMTEIGPLPAKVTSRRKIDPIGRVKKTLREHYAERHQSYNVNFPTSFDDVLARVFSASDSGDKMRAYVYLQKNRQEICTTVAKWTGEEPYNVNQVFQEMIDRCRALGLRVKVADEELQRDTLMMVTVHTMNYLHRTNHEVAI